MYQKISSTKARRLYAARETFYMCPSKIRPEVMGCKIDRWCPEQVDDEPFDNVVNMFRYYNCNKDTGNHVVFYQKIA